MSQRLLFRILGPLEVEGGDGRRSLGGRKPRSLLGVLLLHPGEAVSTEQLIDALWGPTVPASAANSVHIYVSQLRKVLGPERLATRGRGYALELENDELDARQFEQLLEQGRAELRGGHPEQAAETVSEALALWRGPALEDFRYEDFAQVAIARIEELRELALEELIDAKLALGQGAELVPELERLVREHPLRERLRGQLMLALYRAGRQADALEAYQAARRTLGDELGLEPGHSLKELEQAILTQDPALETRRRRGLSPVARPSRVRLLVVGAALLLGAAAIAAALSLSEGGPARLASVAAGSLASIDPKTSRVAAAARIADAPARLATDGRSLWVSNDGAETVSKLDPKSYGVTKVVPVHGFPSDMAVGEGAVWIVDSRTGRLAKVDPVYGTVVSRRTVVTPTVFYDRDREGLDPTAVAAGAGSIWVTDGSRSLIRVEPATAKLSQRIDTGLPLNGVTATASSVWAISGPSATAIRLDRRGHVTTRLTIVSEPGFESPYPLAIAVGAGFIWVLNGNTATVTKIDPAQRTVVATIPIGIEHLPVRIAAGRGAAWVANGDGTLSRIDAASDSVTTIPVGHRLKDVAVAAGAVWTTTGSGLSASPVATAGVGEAGKIKALPTTFCSPLYYAAGARPTVMFASDLPFQGAFRTPAAQVSQAIQFVLKKHGFRAGPYSVAYQSCDDSTAPEGYATPEKCSANATAFSHDRDVIALVAPFNSGCTQEELPIANAAKGGPLPMISFSNTVVGFTHPSAGTPPGTTGSYYPTGTRNYVRIVPADDYQGAANAVLARRLGAKRIYIAREPFEYGIAISAAFRNAARQLGLRVAATTEWDPDARDYGPLARAIKRSRADSVFVAGSMFASGDKVVRSIRSSLGPGVRIITPDGFTPVSQAVQFIGADAEGLTVSVPGAPNERLPRRGKEFIAAFKKAVGETPFPYSVYAAQATEVLLQAIAASDGTRASVLKNLFRTRVSNGILGNFSVDSHGDTTANAITIYRIHGGKPVLLDVITPSASLVRQGGSKR